MSQVSARVTSLACVWLAGSACISADTPGDRLLISRSFQAQRIEVVSIDARSIAYRDAYGAVRTHDAADVLAIISPPADTATGQLTIGPNRRSPHVLELWDGQRHVGRFAPRASGLIAGDEPVVGWDSTLFGALQISLDRVAMMRLAASSVHPPKDLRDHVVLVNGDLMSGYIEHVGEDVVIDADDRAVRIPIARIATVSLGGRAEPVSGHMIWLADGSVVAVREVASRANGRLMVSLQDSSGAARDQTQGDVRGQAEVSLSDLLALSVDGSRLIELASLDPVEQGPTPPRRWSQPLRVEQPSLSILGQGSIHLDGPMRVVWTLPANSLRVRGTAELPESSWTWGDCVLRITAVGADGAERELLRERMSSQRPLVEFSADLPRGGRQGTRLLVTLDEGEHGPVQDRVVLRGVLVLLDEASPQ